MLSYVPAIGPFAILARLAAPPAKLNDETCLMREYKRGQARERISQ